MDSCGIGIEQVLDLSFSLCLLIIQARIEDSIPIFFSELNSFVAENCSMPTKHLWPHAASFMGEFKHWCSLFALAFFKSFWKDLFFTLSTRSGPPALQLRLSEDFVLSTASVFRTKLNRCLQCATDIAVCKDLNLCIKVLLLPSSVPWLCYFIPPKVVLNLKLCVVCMAGSWSTVDCCKIGVMVAFPHSSLDRYFTLVLFVFSSGYPRDCAQDFASITTGFLYFSSSDFQSIFPYCYYSRHLIVNLHFQAVESFSSTCGIMHEDWIISNFFVFLFPEIGLCDLILLQLVASWYPLSNEQSYTSYGLVFCSEEFVLLYL